QRPFDCLRGRWSQQLLPHDVARRHDGNSTPSCSLREWYDYPGVVRSWPLRGLPTRWMGGHGRNPTENLFLCHGRISGDNGGLGAGKLVLVARKASLVWAVSVLIRSGPMTSLAGAAALAPAASLDDDAAIEARAPFQAMDLGREDPRPDARPARYCGL